MNTSPTAFRTEFNELAVQFLWRQWSVLGSGAATGSDDDWAIDPETLVLITSLLGRFDSRLFDQMLDWLCLNGKLISLTRLWNLYSNREIGDPRVIGAISTMIGEKSTLRKWKASLPKWEKRIARSEQNTSPEPQAFFRRTNGEALPVMGATDSAFERFGYLRSPVDIRGLSQTPNPNLRTSLWFKLRALFGVNARSDVMFYLLSHREGHPNEMARRLGYYPKTLQDTLNEMEISGHVRSWRDGREKKFAVRSDDWKFLATWEDGDGNFPRWVDWPAMFTALDRIHRTLMEPKWENASTFLQAAEFRTLMNEGLIRKALADAGLLQGSRIADRLTGEKYVTALMEDFRDLLK